MKRLFIATHLSPKAVSQVADLMRTLKASLSEYSSAQIKWTNLDNLHLTLRFLGSVDESRISDIVQALAKYLQEMSSFLVRPKSIGAFSRKDSQVLWVGLQDDEKRLQTLIEGIDFCLETVGFEKAAKPSTPHLTLARLKREVKIGNLIERHSNFEAVYSLIHQVVLFESQTLPTGAVHLPLWTVSLKQKEAA